MKIKLNIIVSSLVVLAAPLMMAFNSPKHYHHSHHYPIHTHFHHRRYHVHRSSSKRSSLHHIHYRDASYSYRIKGHRYRVLKAAVGYEKKGIASWYGPGFQRHLTSSHTRYNMYSMTAASPYLPMNTYVRVTNLTNHRSVIVKVNDRGPFAKGRIMDLSYKAAKLLNMIHRGTAYVDIQVINPASVSV